MKPRARRGSIKPRRHHQLPELTRRSIDDGKKRIVNPTTYRDWYQEALREANNKMEGLPIAPTGTRMAEGGAGRRRHGAQKGMSPASPPAGRY